MVDRSERQALRSKNTDLRAIFWALAASTAISLACSIFLIMSGTASAQHSMTNIIQASDFVPDTALANDARVGRETNLPLPRFVSLRRSETNMRVGPGLSFEILAIYNRQGLPMQIVAESGHWREVLDWEGTRGWVHKDLLSGRRTARVMTNTVTMTRQPNQTSEAVAYLAYGVLGTLKSIRGDWCLLEVDKLAGWVPKSQLFAVLDTEVTLKS